MKKEELKDLIREFEGTSLTKLSIEEKDFKVCLEKNNGISPVVVANQPAVQNTISNIQETSAPKKTINAPLVGTFYLTRSPDSKPVATVGQKVNIGDTVGIIEAMKVMNEIQADKEGVIKAILAPSGKLVEFDQPLLEIE
ncbi:MAG: acetyl-CoA carboxylase biotin carboxyl carrier protein [Longicatena sp.]|jgi:acetyl-CoA carboxylase biotin carboxyl carrier protein|uniref:acetyl-CoA carboxylase biotin carboxyl carrier protein n=1 Tax=Anaerorhabdus sp. TaxID=1872524 RepID=UPI002FCB4D80